MAEAFTLGVFQKRNDRSKKGMADQKRELWKQRGLGGSGGRRTKNGGWDFFLSLPPPPSSHLSIQVVIRNHHPNNGIHHQADPLCHRPDCVSQRVDLQCHPNCAHQAEGKRQHHGISEPQSLKRIRGVRPWRMPSNMGKWT